MLEIINSDNLTTVEKIEERVRELRMAVVMLPVEFHKTRRHMDLQFLLNLNLDILDYIRGIKPKRLTKKH